MNSHEAHRLFVAHYLRTEVPKDGQVPGFSSWYDTLSEHGRTAYTKTCNRVLREVSTGKNPEEVIASAARDLRTAIKNQPAEEERPAPEYVRIRVSIINRLMNGYVLTPNDVADELEKVVHHFPAHGLEREILAYREMGDVWDRRLL